MAITVVKCGGAVLARGGFVLAQHADVDASVCVVHGAGSRITAALDAARIESRFVGGRRVTDEQALPLVAGAFRAENRALVEQIGARAEGLCGDEIGLEADPLPGLARAGMLRPVVPARLALSLASGRVPVVAPLALSSRDGGLLNVNADDAAAVLAIALGADQLVFVSDVDGVIVDGEVLGELSAGDIAGLGGALSGGIVPKLEAAVAAAREGVLSRVGRTLVVA